MCLAVPTQITAIRPDGMATVVLDGIERQISLALTPEARVGDYVLIHTGYAIAVMDPEEAAESLAAFEELARIQDDLDAQGDEGR